MAKRFGLRLSRVIPSFQSCRSKDDAGVTFTNPAFRLSPVNRNAFDIDFPPPPPPLSSPSFLRRPQPPVVFGPACGCLPSRHGCRFSPADDWETPAYLWRKEEKWHVVAYAGGGGRYDFPSSPRRKIDSDHGCDILQPAAMAKARRREAKLRRRRRRVETKRSSRSGARVSTSSAESGWFSSEGDEENDEQREGNYFDEEEDDGETETLVSSTDCSSDNVLRRRRIRRRRRREVVKCYPLPERTAAAVLRRLVPCGAAAATAAAEGKVRESFAVVKRSEDPRADFRRSMAEMVVEKEMYDASDLEQLLRCFLSLNSRHHHGAIVAAFSDIWEALFSATATPAAAPAVPKK